MGTPVFSFRPATAADAAELAAFAERVFIETFGPDNTPEDMDAYARSTFSPDLQTREIAEPDALMLLAFAADADADADVDGDASDRARLAGYAHLMRSEVPSEVSEVGGDGDVLEVRRFYVGKEWQGSGLAKTLMLEIMRHARARGARRVWLGVWERNGRAIAFYRKLGFQEVGSHVFMLGSDRQTDLLMAVSL